MPDLSTTYLGLRLDSPLVPSASPLSRSLDNLKRMEDAGAGAVVLHSLFEEQINFADGELDPALTGGANQSALCYAEALNYFPEPTEYRLAPDQYLEHIRLAKQAVRIPIIGSLNGVSTGGWICMARQASWIKYARLMQAAGADALELNPYFMPTDPEVSSDEVEDMVADLVVDISHSVTIPVSVKLSPFYSALPYLARRLARAGARGLALFNRFYQPDFDLDTLDVAAHLTLSTSDELRLPLRWIAILHHYGYADLALTTGVHTAGDAAKGILAGAHITMLASALLSNGIDHLRTVRTGLLHWMEAHSFASVAQMRGQLSDKSVAYPAAFERAQYVRIIGTAHGMPMDGPPAGNRPKAD